MAFDSGEETWLRTSLDSDGRLEPLPPPGMPLTLVVTVVVTAAAGAAEVEVAAALRPLLALTPVPVLAAPLLSADPLGLGSVPVMKSRGEMKSETGFSDRFFPLLLFCNYIIQG